MNFNKTLLTLILASLLGACGGNDGSGGFFESPGDDDSGGETGGGTGGGGTGGGTGGGGGTGTTNVSYLPLQVYEAYKEFSGYDTDAIFQGYTQFPLIRTHLINPINATTLAPISNATASDYQVMVDESVLIDDYESFPMLQKVIGTPIRLRTALVFDVSNSMQRNVDMAELVEEAKAYVAATRLSNDPIIANQEFVVWGFGSSVAGFDADDVPAIDDLETDATFDTDIINSALDELLDAYEERSLGTGTNLHRAVVQAIGRYTEEDFEFGEDGDNDLIDSASMDYIYVSQMVVFSSGPDTYLEMTQELMEKAISSQSFAKYDETSTTRDALLFLNKPVFYYVVGGNTVGTEYEPLSEKAEVVTSLRLQEGEYSFASDLIEDQIAAIDSRIDLDNQYVYRYAFIPRNAEHETIFKSNTSGYSYSLTTQYSEERLSDPSIQGTPSELLDSLVEITGPNGEYLSAGFADIAEVREFAPATRWTNEVYDPVEDYEWEPAPGITGSVNSEGHFIVESIASDGLQLTLRNTLRGPDDNDDDLPDGETFTIILYDSRN